MSGIFPRLASLPEIGSTEAHTTSHRQFILRKIQEGWDGVGGKIRVRFERQSDVVRQVDLDPSLCLTVLNAALGCRAALIRAGGPGSGEFQELDGAMTISELYNEYGHRFGTLVLSPETTVPLGRSCASWPDIRMALARVVLGHSSVAPVPPGYDELFLCLDRTRDQAAALDPSNADFMDSGEALKLLREAGGKGDLPGKFGVVWQLLEAIVAGSWRRLEEDQNLMEGYYRILAASSSPITRVIQIGRTCWIRHLNAEDREGLPQGHLASFPEEFHYFVPSGEGTQRIGMDDWSSLPRRPLEYIMKMDLFDRMEVVEASMKALQALHQSDCYLKDFSPSYIGLDTEGRLCLTDSSAVLPMGSGRFDRGKIFHISSLVEITKSVVPITEVANWYNDLTDKVFRRLPTAAKAAQNGANLPFYVMKMVVESWTRTREEVLNSQLEAVVQVWPSGNQNVGLLLRNMTRTPDPNVFFAETAGSVTENAGILTRYGIASCWGKLRVPEVGEGSSLDYSESLKAVIALRCWVYAHLSEHPQDIRMCLSRLEQANRHLQHSAALLRFLPVGVGMEDIDRDLLLKQEAGIAAQIEKLEERIQIVRAAAGPSPLALESTPEKKLSKFLGQLLPPLAPLP